MLNWNFNIYKSKIISKIFLKLHCNLFPKNIEKTARI